MNFLGNVNIFHGRVEQGRALLGPLARRLSRARGRRNRGRRPATRARTSSMSRAPTAAAACGPSSRPPISPARSSSSSSLDDERKLLQVEVAREHYDALNPKIGERLYVRPKKIRVFVEQLT